MRRAALLAVASGALATTATSPAIAQSYEEQKMFTPQVIKWSPAPPSLPAGAEVALLYGDATKEGLFALRIKAPKGYRVPGRSRHSAPRTCLRCSGAILSAWIDPVSHNSAVHHHRDHDGTIRPYAEIGAPLRERKEARRLAIVRGVEQAAAYPVGDKIAAL